MPRARFSTVFSRICFHLFNLNTKTMKTKLNYTPHTIFTNDGHQFPSLGVARVSNTFTTFDADGVCNVKYGDIEGLPDPEPDTLYIVSAMVLAASDRTDLIAPATGHPDCKRENGFIKSVPGFISK